MKDIYVSETETVKNVLKKLDKTAEKILLVTDSEQRFLGTITDGDIRRYILRGRSLERTIKTAYNRKPIYIRREEFSKERAKKILLDNKLDLLPVLDDEKRVIDYITWNQAFSEEKLEPRQKSKVDVPVVIMAGGEGTRLEPFTKILPKPLIPIGDRTIIEVIMEEFRAQGVKDFYLTLNYKGDMIEAYFNYNGNGRDYRINYLREDDYLGTAGGLKMLEGVIDDTFIVSNCDVIVKANFEQVLALHKEQQATMTILSSIQYYKVPYGVVKFRGRGEVLDIIEKPEYTLTVNTGVYVLNKEVLQLIPEESSFDMTDLVKKLIEEGRRVITYPVNENDYVDIGHWDEYKRAVEKLQLVL